MTNSCFIVAAAKNLQSDRIDVSVGIVWVSHVPARQCTSTQSLWDGQVSGSSDTWLQPPVNQI